MVKKRSEIAKEDTWALEDLFPTEEAYDKGLEEWRGLTARLGEMEGKLATSAIALLDFLQLSDQIDLLATALGTYAFCRGDEDTASPHGKQLMGRFQNTYIAYARASAFAAPEIIEMEDSTLETFMRELPELENYRRCLAMIRLKKEHTLSLKEERILAGSAEMANAASTIYNVLVDSDMRFPDVADQTGELHSLTHGTYIPMMESNDRVLRKNAFESLYHTYASFGRTISACLNAQITQNRFYAQNRGYANTLEASLAATEVPVAVYHNLIATVHENMHYMHRYMELRKKWLGLDEMHMYDLYNPVVSDAAAVIPFEQAKKTVLESVAPLGKEYCEIYRQGLESRWIDIYENEGKRSGAYSAGALPHPFVLLNHTDDLSSEFTLAHEMGHAMHSYLSMHRQPTVYANYVIFVAEVASTCNEALLMAHLLKSTTDRQQRAYLINYFLEQFRTTLYRQTMFAEFELECHRMSESGQTLTSDALCELYHRLNAEYYGPDVVIDSEIDIEWARIPHFYRYFYVFQYATGFSAAMALSQKILTEGSDAVQHYLDFLSGGCSKDPISLLRDAGVDMASPDPINRALKQFGELMEELDALMEG